MNFDHSHIFNATYSYSFGRNIKSGPLGLLLNNWVLSGITGIQSGANMQTGISANPNFYLAGFITAPGQPALAINNQVFLGTPDVNLQPVLKCNPTSGLGSHQFINGACFGLPQIGQNGQYILPYAHGPAFFNTDLSAEKGFSLGRQESKLPRGRI